MQTVEEALKNNAFMNGGNTDAEKDFFAMGFKAAFETSPASKLNTGSEVKLLCPTCNKGGLYTKNGYIWCDNKKCKAIFEQQDTID